MEMKRPQVRKIVNFHGYTSFRFNPAITMAGSGNHAYFRSECANTYRLPFPAFLVVGNREVAYNEMKYDANKVSLTDFEKIYGQLNFSFEYRGNGR